ncbi:hypothetical protein BBBOND_0109470 [Babesia bigemina]|uniref:Uncharacterized protein n=1 Tax=Babesia bigemina TaxID=5866 RepID=A0A061D6T5_BABBI|nr:hypothetical protein BBBOND_0109470 [Babesia bigemina]CDR94649.1 hypothetical protein BBBOND_0109470 [Babesia bigemina]|eukprot:XP_012766835.1 hypothetical protein BBBOND_0109470 [Babesia bigemina]
MAGGRMAARQVEGKDCVCFILSCKGENELCADSTCTTCMACCSPGCKDCKEHCEKGQKCRCLNLCCGCPTNCYKDGFGEASCKKKNQTKGCKRCETKCAKSERCICYQCDCGTQCNGFLCACCYWCNPGKCKRKGTCDGFVLGKCYSGEGNKKCKGHGTYNDEGRPEYVDNCTCEPKNSNSGCTCYKSKYDNKCRCIRGVPDEYGNCVIKCDLCGKLCSQDSYIHQGTLVVVPLAIAMVLIIVWCKYRDIIRKVFYELRGSSSRAPKHSSAYTNNLVGDKIPEQSSTDRYSAIRPMPYVGLS